MKISGLFFLFAVASLAPLSVEAQSTLNTTPSRSLGQDKFELNPRSGNPNLVEGREFFFPWFVTVDKYSTPPAVYVSDAFNNRVLGWKNANAFLSGSMADIVIGQIDRFTTTPSAPGTSRSIELSLPRPLPADSTANLYLA